MSIFSASLRNYRTSGNKCDGINESDKELADLLCHAGEFDAAIDHYNAALRLRPNFPEAKDNLAFAHSLAGHLFDVGESARSFVARD